MVLEYREEISFQDILDKALKEEECFKGQELRQIVMKISHTKYSLQQLRMCLVSEEIIESPVITSNPLHQTWSQFEEQFDRSGSVNAKLFKSLCTSTVMESNASESDDTSTEVMEAESVRSNEFSEKTSNEINLDDIKFEVNLPPYDNLTNGNISLNKTTPSKCSNTLVTNMGTVWFNVRHSVIVGNTSQYLERVASSNDKVTHKWMIYVRSFCDEDPVETFTKCVTFFLHPTYSPNDIVTVTRPPFQLTKLGWGEFPVRVQLQFKDSLNKPVDILHPLKLDQTHSGQQMLGAETHVNIELVHCDSSSDMYNSMLPTVTQTNSTPPCSPNCNPPYPPSSISSSQLPPSCSLSSPSSPATPAHISFSPLLSPPLYFSPPQSPFTHGLSPLYICSQSPPHSPPPPLSPPPPEYVIIPVKMVTDSILLDHDYHKQTLVKYINDKSCVKIHSLFNFLNSDTLMRNAVSQLSLYGSSHPFSAQSFAHYCDWSLPKQRANEWMRAVAIRQHISQFKECLLPSTRQIVSWCRSHGYTPLRNKVNFCKVCGHPLNNKQHVHCILPNYLTTLSDVNLFVETLKFDTPESSSNSTIDIITHSHNHLVKNEDIVHRIPKFPELRWINKTANEVGVILCPISHDKMLLHVIEHMIFSACSQFLCQLLRKAVSMNSSGSVVERIIIPLHLYEAIKTVPKFDFLTDSGLGFPMT